MSIKPIPRKVKYTERKDGIKTNATIVKEVSEVEPYPWGDFYRVIQLIRKEGEPEDIFRFGYYVKDHGAEDKDYRWGSQTTFMCKRSTLDKLLSKAKSEEMF